MLVEFSTQDEAMDLARFTRVLSGCLKPKFSENNLPLIDMLQYKRLFRRNKLSNLQEKKLENKIKN